jgi:hypothetical protein
MFICFTLVLVGQVVTERNVCLFSGEPGDGHCADLLSVEEKEIFLTKFDNLCRRMFTR